MIYRLIEDILEKRFYYENEGVVNMSASKIGSKSDGNSLLKLALEHEYFEDIRNAPRKHRNLLLGLLFMMYKLQLLVLLSLVGTQVSTTPSARFITFTGLYPSSFVDLGSLVGITSLTMSITCVQPIDDFRFLFCKGDDIPSLGCGKGSSSTFDANTIRLT